MSNKYVNLIVFTVGVFVLGLFSSSEFRYNTPVTADKWVITLIFSLGNLALFFGNSKGE